MHRPPSAPPAFLITIDTEGDYLWSKPREITTENARHLPRFQALCERTGFAPTYLTNWEMATSPVFQELGKAWLAKGTAEIGMHLHAWNSPPVVALTDDDHAHQPYLVEFGARLIDEKVKVMTDKLGEVFGARPVSHRAGRWAMDERYARALLKHGYEIDCSVTPHVSWRGMKGDPRALGGADYTRAPERPYELLPGLLEAPMTIKRRLALPRAIEEHEVVKKLSARLTNVRWLRPRGGNLREMIALLDDVIAKGDEYAMFMIHSSELMAGCSPTFPNARTLDALYDDLEALFASARGRFRRATLAEYARARREDVRRAA